MTVIKPVEQPETLADQAAESADHAIRTTQRVTHDVLDKLAGNVQDMRQQVSPLLQRAGEQTSALTQQGLDAVHGGAQAVRDQVRQTGDSTIEYVKAEPVKAMLIAAAAGAALTALIGLMGRSRDRT